MSDGVKLRDCPFCGASAVRWTAGELADEGIINELAGCYGNDPERRHPFLRMTPTAWNTRKSDDGWRTMESALEGISNAIRIGAASDVIAWSNLAEAMRKTAINALDKVRKIVA